MADVEASVDISVEGAGALEDAAEAARNLAQALRDAEESAASIGAAFEDAARGLSSLRDDAEEAAQALKSIRDAGAGVGDVAVGAEAAAEGLASMRDEAAEAEAAFDSLVAAGPGIGDIAAFAEEDAEALGHLRDEAIEAGAAVDSLSGAGGGLAGDAAGAGVYAASLGHIRDEAVEADAALASLKETQAAQDLLNSTGTRYGTELGEQAAAQGMTIGHYTEQLKNLIDQAEESKQAAGSIEQTVADVRGALAMMSEGETVLVSKTGAEQFSEVLTKDADSLEAFSGKVKGAKVSLDDLGDSAESQLSKLNLAQDFLSAGQAASEVAPKIKAAWDAIAEAAPVINDAETEISGLRDDLRGLGDSAGGGFLGGPLQGFLNILKGIDKQSASLDDLAAGGEKFKSSVEDQVAAMQKFSAAYHAYQATGAWDDLTRLQAASDDLDAKMASASSAGEDFSSTFGDIDTAAQAATAGMTGTAGAVAAVEQGADDAEEAGGSFAASLGQGFSGIAESAGTAVTGMAPMAGLVGGIATAAAGVVPAAAAATAGIVGFGLLGAPALEKVKAGYSAVTQAQQAYQQAVGVEQRDPSKSNLESEQKALATLQTTWAQMPQPIARSVSAIQQFGHEFSKVSKDSGIQKDVLSDIPKAIKVATDALPSLSGLAKSTAPVISGMFKDLDKNVQSPAFKNFMKSIDNDVEPASSALHKLAGAAGGFISTLQEKGAGASNQFITGLSSLIKTATPEAVSGLVNGVKAMTSAMNGLNKVMNSSQAKESGNILDKIWHGGAVADKYGGKFLKDFFGGDELPSWMSGKYPAPKIPKVDPGELEKQLGAGRTELPLPVKVKPEVKAAAPGGLIGELEKALGAGGKLAGGKALQVPIEAKVSKVDTSGLKDGDLKIPATAKIDKVDTSGSVHATTPVKVSGATVDLSGAKVGDLGSLASSLTAAGSAAGHSFDTGVAAGIAAGAGQAKSAATGVVGDIKAALSTLGAAGTAAGDALGEGLAAGINASKGAAVSAAVNMANAVTAAVKAAHASASPSKVFAKIGSDDIEGYIIGLEGGKSALSTAAKDVASLVNPPFKDVTIADTIKDLEDRLKDELKAGDISASQETGISAWLSADNKRLQALAQQRKTLESDISAADSLYKSVDQATIQGANVATFAGNIASQPTMNEWLNSGGPSSGPMPTGPTSIQQALRQYLRQTREFRSDIIKLKKEGLDETSLQQLLQAGVTSGLPAANMMLSGGAAGVRQIASLQKQIGAAAGQLGVTGANAAYEPASDIGGGLAAGLQQELSSVSAAIKGLATSIVDEMRGVTPGHTATPILADAGGKGGGDIHIHLDVGGTEIAQVVQKYALQHARRNTGTGLQLKGRGT